MGYGLGACNMLINKGKKLVRPPRFELGTPTMSRLTYSIPYLSITYEIAAARGNHNLNEDII